MKTKNCTKCGIDKTLDKFAKTRIVYFRTLCAVCYSEYCIKNNQPENLTRYKKEKLTKKTTGGCCVHVSGNMFNFIYKGLTMSTHKTRQAAEQVIAKHKLRESRRKLEDKAMLHDSYYDDL